MTKDSKKRPITPSNNENFENSAPKTVHGKSEDYDGLSRANIEATPQLDDDKSFNAAVYTPFNDDDIHAFMNSHAEFDDNDIPLDTPEDVLDSSRGVKRAAPESSPPFTTRSDQISVLPDTIMREYYQINAIHTRDSIKEFDYSQLESKRRSSIFDSSKSCDTSLEDYLKKRTTEIGTISDPNSKTDELRTFKGALKLLKKRKCPEIMKGVEEEITLDDFMLNWVDKTFGVDCRSAERDIYLNPKEWIYDDIMIEAVANQDIPNADDLMSTVSQSSQLQADLTAADQDTDSKTLQKLSDDGELINDFHPCLHKKMNILRRGMKCIMDLTGYRSIYIHAKANESEVPFDPVKPSHMDSRDIVAALSDNVHSACQLNLRVIDSNFFETSLRFAAIHDGDQWMSTLIKAAEVRLSKVIWVATEDAGQIMSEPSRRIENTGTVSYFCGPLDTALHEAHKKSEMTLRFKSNSKSARPSTAGSRNSVTAPMSQRSRRSSIVKTDDDERLAFIHSLTNSEKEFYDEYRRQLLPELIEESSLFDTLLHHLSSEADKSTLELLSIDRRALEDPDIQSYIY